MTDKEFKRLSRSQLIDIIYQLQLKQKELAEENEKLSKELTDKRLRVNEAGNIAEAAIEIHNVMMAAQDAAAHNYASHFGRLTQLQTGDLVLFTDAAGQIHYYEVVLLETLPPTATEEMITSGFALSLYTCTPGGSNRVTVRCNAVNE
jgi:hypothetical protein